MVLLFFLLTVLVTYLALVKITRFAPRFYVPLGVWLLLTLLIAEQGALADFSRRPPPMLLLIAASVILTTSLALSSYGRRLAVDTPIAWLVGFQAFRILVEIFLDWGSHEGLVPPQMTFEGRNWDILTGISAIPVAWLAARGRMPRGGILAWNLLGAGLLLNVVTVAMLSIPTPLQRFTPPNTFITGPPYVWLPVFLVQAAWFGHLLVFRRLAHRVN